MNFVERRPYSDPEAAMRKILELANAITPVQDGRVYIEALKGWARDVSEEIAVACAIEGDHVPAALEGFIDQHRMPWPEQLPLPLRRAANKC